MHHITKYQEATTCVKGNARMTSSAQESLTEHSTPTTPHITTQTHKTMTLSPQSFILLFTLVTVQVVVGALSTTTPMRRIVVTGANSGIGLALTKQLVKDHGCHVYLGSRDIIKGQRAVDEVKKTAGDSVELLNIDVSKDESVQAAAESLGEKLASEKLYAIVNNVSQRVHHLCTHLVY